MEARFRTEIESPWTAMPPLKVGPVRLGTPTTFVTIERDGAPLLRIDVYESEPACHVFQEAIEWHGWLVIGFGDHVHFVSLELRDTHTFSLGGYFGHLYPFESQLLVADAERLHCFDPSGSLLWRSSVLGIDGVIVSDVADGLIEGSGEWDPPDGWRPFRVLLSSGRSQVSEAQ